MSFVRYFALAIVTAFSFVSAAHATVVSYGLVVSDGELEGAGSVSITVPSSLPGQAAVSDFLAFEFSVSKPVVSGGLAWDFADLLATSFADFDDTGVLTEIYLVAKEASAGFPEFYFHWDNTGSCCASIDATRNGTRYEAETLAEDGGTIAINSAPEPATLALFGLGLAGFGFSRRRAH